MICKDTVEDTKKNGILPTTRRPKLLNVGMVQKISPKGTTHPPSPLPNTFQLLHTPVPPTNLPHCYISRVSWSGQGRNQGKRWPELQFE